MANTSYPNNPTADWGDQLIEAADIVGIQVNDKKVVGVQIVGTFVATIEFEGSVDGVNFVPVSLTPVGGGAAVTTAAAPGIFTGNVAGLTKFQVKSTAYTSGAAVAKIHLTP